MNSEKRLDLHVHSFLSDGALLPSDMIDQEMARLVATVSGLNEEEIQMITVVNPQALIQRVARHYVQWA